MYGFIASRDTYDKIQASGFLGAQKLSAMKIIVDYNRKFKNPATTNQMIEWAVKMKHPRMKDFRNPLHFNKHMKPLERQMAIKTAGIIPSCPVTGNKSELWALSNPTKIIKYKAPKSPRTIILEALQEIENIEGEELIPGRIKDILEQLDRRA